MWGFDSCYLLKHKNSEKVGLINQAPTDKSSPSQRKEYHLIFWGTPVNSSIIDFRFSLCYKLFFREDEDIWQREMKKKGV